MAGTLKSENEPAAKKKKPETKKTEKDCFDEDTVQVSNRANVIDFFCLSNGSIDDDIISMSELRFEFWIVHFHMSFRIFNFRVEFSNCVSNRLFSMFVSNLQKRTSRSARSTWSTIHEARFKGRESAEGQGQQGSLHSLTQDDVDEAHYSGGPRVPQTPHKWHVQVPHRHYHDGEEDSEEHIGPRDHQCSLVARAAARKWHRAIVFAAQGRCRMHSSVVSRKKMCLSWCICFMFSKHLVPLSHPPWPWRTTLWYCLFSKMENMKRKWKFEIPYPNIEMISSLNEIEKDRR